MKLKYSKLSLAALSGITLALTAPSLSAADGTWLGTSGDWGNAGTWSGGIADGTGFTANFTGVDITTDQIINLEAARTIGNITFTDTTTSSNNLTISGANILTLDVASGASLIDVTQADRTLTISSQIAGADGLQKNGLGTLILSGANSYTGITTVSAGTLSVGHASALGTAGDNNHTIVGSGATLDLNGFSIAEQFGKSSATQTDGFVDSTSILTNSSATAAAVTGGIFFNNGGAFTVNGSNGGITLNTVANSTGNTVGITLTKSGANTLTLAGTVDNSFLAMSVSAGTVILGKTSNAGVHAVGSGLTLNNAAIVQLGGSGNDQIYNDSDVTLNGTSTLDMNGKNETINGLTGVSGTTIYNTANGSASTLTVGNFNGTTAFGGVIANNAGGGQTGTLAVTKLGAGTLTLSGSNTYTGGTRVSAGVLSVNTIADSGTSAIGTAGTLFLSGGTLAFTGTTGTTARTVSLTAASGLDVATSGTLTLNGAVSGGFNLTKTGDGKLVLGGTADNADLRLNVTSGVVELNKTTNATSRAVAGITAIASGATVKLTGTNGDQIFGGNNNVAYGINGVAGTLDLNGKSESTSFLNGTSTGVVDGSSGTPTLTVGESNVSSTFAGTIKNTAGTLALTKIGTGTLTLSGANTYTGATTISSGGGSFILNNLNAIQNSTSVSVASGTSLRFDQTGTYATAGTISIAGTGLVGLSNPGALWFGQGGNISSTLNAPINLTAAATISSFGVTMNTTLGGAISGTGPLTISSQGGAVGHFATWTLGAASNYTGSTIFNNVGGANDATVKLGINDALPTTTSLNLQASNSLNVATFTTFDLNGRNQTLAGLTDTGGTKSAGSNAGKRVINSSGTLSTLTLNIASGTNTYGTTGTNITAGTIGGLTGAGVAANNLALTKTGAGTLILTSTASSFTGNILISNGTLSATGGSLGLNPTTSALGNTQFGGRTITISSGGTLNFGATDVMGNSGTTVVATLVANGGTIRNTGANFNALGPVQLNGGTLSSFGGFNGSFPSFFLNGTVTVGGSAVSTISSTGTDSQMGLRDAGTTFDVADAVSGSGSDLNVTGVLANWSGAANGAVIKTGVGTMTLSNINTYTGLTRIDNGTLTLGHATNTLANTGAVNVNGGTLALGTNTDTVGAVTLTSGSITGTGAGTLTGTGSAFDVRSGTISAKLGGTVGLTKTTAGSVTISSDNSVGGYTGATLVSAGSLIINGNISTSITTTVNGTGTLAGIGTVGATTVQAGGTLAPGNSIGTLNFTNTLSLAGISNFEIDPLLGMGLNADLANVTNGVTYGGTLNVLYGGANANFANGMAFNLFDASSFSGTFGTVNLPDLTGTGLSWQNNLLSNGTLTVIPEPSAALLGGLGMLLLLRRRRN